MDVDPGLPGQPVAHGITRFAQESQRDQTGDSYEKRLDLVPRAQIIEDVFQNERFPGIDHRQDDGNYEKPPHGSAIWEGERHGAAQSFQATRRRRTGLGNHYR